MAIKFSDAEIEAQINKIGSKSNPRYKFVCDTGKKVFGDRLIKIINLETKETAICRMGNLKSGHNPWSKKYSIQEIKNDINKIGAKSNPRYKFVGDTGKYKNHQRLIKIQNLKTKKNITYPMDELKRGKNPWNETQERHETQKVHPKIKAVLNKLNIKFEHEVQLSRRSRVDFVLTNKDNRKILIEVKSDKKQHSKKSLTEQISKYKTDGKLKYGNSYATTLLVSLNGRYGLPLKELKSVLEQKGFIST